VSIKGDDNADAVPPASDLLAPMISLLSSMADFVAANRRRFDPCADSTAGSPSRDQDGGAAAADLMLPMGHAVLIAANRSVSYWLGLIQIFESHRAKLAPVAGEETNKVSALGLERLVAADELRALLREVGDLATREARILQSELRIVDESLAQSFQQPDSSSYHKRRWRSKV
jgi:hypothetical protein